MGLDVNAVRFLISAQKQGVSFTHVLTIGRQDLNIFPKKLRQVLKEEGLPVQPLDGEEHEILYSDGFFQCLGSKQITGLDMSSFEGAGLVHDLNHPVPQELHEKYDVVYDGGTLEHVFNFPVALQNCMQMVKVGGRLIVHTVANNYCGHGFYQFSPELFYRTLEPKNGYRIERAVLHPMGPYGNWRSILDPEAIACRVELMSIMPMQMLIQAVRIEAVPTFRTFPQQSDYTPRWKEQNRDNSSNSVSAADNFAPARSSLAKILPGLARFWNAAITGLSLLRNYAIWNRRCFKRISKK